MERYTSAAAGLPSSTVLAVSTVLFVVVLGAPFARKFERLRRRYGLGAGSRRQPPSAPPRERAERKERKKRKPAP